MTVLGQSPWGIGAFGSDTLIAHPAGNVNIVPTTSPGPDLVLSYTFAPPSWLIHDPPDQLWTRTVLARSDGQPAPSGAPTFYDTGWVNGDYATSGNLTLNLVNLALPTDTGSGSVDPSLHYFATVYASVSADSPPVTGWYTIAGTGAFDIQWGVSTLAWALAPPSQVPGGEVTASWLLTSTRGVGQGTWEVSLTDAGGSTLYYDSGLQTGTTDSFTVPYDLENDTSYRETINAANSNGIPATPISALFVSAIPNPKPPVTGGPLQRFLALIGFQMDIDRSYLEQLRNLNNPRLCPGNFLRYLAQQFGVAYEDNLGMAQTRKLLQNIVYLYKMKGTVEGITGIATAVTGWVTTLTVGPNLFLGPSHTFGATGWIGPQAGTADMGGVDGPTPPPYYGGSANPTVWPSALPNDVYVPAVGFWRAANDVLAAAHTETARSSAHGIDSGGSGTSAGHEHGAVEAISTARAGVTEEVSGVFSSLMGLPPSQGGISVQGMTGDLSAAVWVWGQSFTGGEPEVAIGVSQYDQFGSLLGTTSSSTASLAAGTWTHLTLAGVALATGAVWAEIHVSTGASTWAPAESAILVLAGPLLVNASSLPSAWTPARELLLNLIADRINLLANPSFEGDSTTGWSASGATIAVTTTAAFVPPNAVLANAGHSLELIASAAGTVSVTSASMTINPVELYTASAYLQAETVARQAQLSLVVYDSSSNVLKTIQGTAVNEVVGDWVRINVMIPPNQPLPANAAEAAVVVTLTDVAEGEIHYLDAVLLETGWALQPYFDGNVFGTTDYFYTTGTTGPSYYYSNYTNKLIRLFSVLNGTTDPDAGYISPLSVTGFLPLGATCALVTPEETYTQ